MKKYLKVVKIFFSLGIITLLFCLVDVGTLWKQILEIQIKIFVIAFAILFVQCNLSTLKWKIILISDGKYVPYFFLLKSYLIANFISLFLPSSFGGDLYRVYVLRRYNSDYLQNTSSVIFDRMTGLFALLSISLLSFGLFFKGFVDVRILVFYFAGILIFWFVTSQRFLKISERYQSKLIEFPRRVLISFSRYRRNIPFLTLIIGISFFFQSNLVFLNKIYAVALDIDVDLSYLFLVIPIVYLTEALPISINGIGVREGALVFFFSQAGFTPEQGFAQGLLLISTRYLFSIFLGGSLFFLELIKTKLADKE